MICFFLFTVLGITTQQYQGYYIYRAFVVISVRVSI